MIYIGIDTGTDTGFAVWDTRAQRLTDVRTLKIHQAMEMVLDIVESVGGNALVVFEDARQRKWIPAEGTLSKWKGRAMGAGSIKRDASIWEDFLLDKRIPFEKVPPRPGLTKWKAGYFAHVTGYKGRTSDHGRDAALLVWGR